RVPKGEGKSRAENGYATSALSSRHGAIVRRQIAFGDNLVAAVALGGVEAFVGALDQGLRRVGRPQQRNPDRNRDTAKTFAARSFQQLLVHHRAPDLVGAADRRALRRLRQRDGEFLAAVTRGDVLAFDDLLDRNGNQAKNLIVGEVSETIVES